MCGIIGTSNNKIEEIDFKIGLNYIKHRGPDDQSFKRNSSVIFGHARLSILDLEERSNQPFEYTHGNRQLLLTFNGEIYNYQLIKRKLKLKGYSFQTESDTEVVCAAYLEYGTKCFDFFEGMWAVAINEGDNIIISRDRIGKKPLYYCLDGAGEIYFSSSFRSVAYLSNFQEISKEAVELYFSLGFIPGKYSIIENINKLEPGNYIRFTRGISGFEIIEKNISKFNVKGLKNESFKKVFKEAVKKRLISDVPISTLMSGGIDSTIVSSITTEIEPRTEAFFVDFENKKYSEKKWSHKLAVKNNINLTTVLLQKADLAKAFNLYYNVYEEPFADYSGIPSIAIFKEVSKNYKVVLTGDGGDELFYGYPHYIKKFFLYKFFTLLKVLQIFKVLPKAISRIIKGEKKQFESNYLKNHGIVTPFAASVINREFNHCIERSKSFLKGVINYDRKFYNWPEKYLVKIDRASMFSGVEVRSPFMDENVLKKVKSISTLLLFTPFNLKLFLKIKYWKLFGTNYLFSKKRGFTPPIEYLRSEFKKEDFLELREYLKQNFPDLFKAMKEIDYSSLKDDTILFDRFFFFNEWRKNWKILSLKFNNQKIRHNV